MNGASQHNWYFSLACSNAWGAKQSRPKGGLNQDSTVNHVQVACKEVIMTKCRISDVFPSKCNIWRITDSERVVGSVNYWFHGVEELLDQRK